MRLIRSASLLFCIIACACERHADQPAPPAANPEPVPALQNKQSTSIIRPEVAEEVATPEAPPPAEQLRAVIVFERGAELDDASREALNDLIAQPAFSNGGIITLSGHSDASGSDADNLNTSRRRAEAVRDYLLSTGVDAERITLVALGERRPIAPNARPDGSDDPEGRRRNRRVEITVTPAAPPAVAPAEPVG